MERWKRLLYYLVINVAVSACTILAVLAVWERVNQSAVLIPTQIVRVITATLPPAAQVNQETAAPASPTAPLAQTEFETYTVRPGDTLGAIAAAFGITVEEILAANDLENPDVLDVGDVLRIPLPSGAGTGAGAPTQTAAPADTLPPPTLSPQQSSTSLPPGFDPEIEIVTVIAPGNLADERVVIRLNGAGELALLGWRLQDEDGNQFLFPELTLFQDGAVTVYTKAGANNVVELYWGLGAAVWQSGETVMLADPQGNEQASYIIP